MKGNVNKVVRSVVKRAREQAKQEKETNAALLEEAKLMCELEHASEEVSILQAKLENLHKRSSEEKPSDSRSKRPKYMENPFEVEKSSYNRRLLQSNNPFLDIFTVSDSKEMPADNVSDAKLMDEAALTLATRILLKPVVTTSRQYKSTNTELGSRILHASILQNLKLLTKPSSSAIDDLAGSLICAEGKEEIRVRECDEGADHTVDPYELVKLDRYDLKGKVHDMNLGSQDNLVTVIVIECDWMGTLSKLDQGSAYAIRAAKSNMRKGRYEPIYVHHWSKGFWRYGVLRPHGIVTVKDGTVIKFCNKQGVHKGAEALVQDQKLKECTKQLCEDYLLPKVYPDNDYVLGTLHLCQKEMTLPMSVSVINEGGLQFFNSLIRTFLGDRALALTEEDVKENCAIRKASFCEDLDYCISSISATYKRLTRQKVRGW